MKSKQLISKKIGDSGCYFLSLVYIAEKILNKEIDVISLYDEAVNQGWMGVDCYMKTPALMMSFLLKKKSDVRHETIDYKPLQNEYEITRYESKGTGATFAHFVVTKDNEVLYDPFGKSRTVKQGKPVSKRIIKIW